MKIRTYKKLKPIYGIILMIISAAELFWLSPIMGQYLGLYGTFLSEVVLLGLAVLTVLAGKGDLREVFPIRRPGATKTVGTILLWMGTFLIVMILTLIITVFYPEEMAATSGGLGEAFTSVPFMLSLVIVAITPAICEEAVFRGVVVHSFLPMRNKWVIIILTGLIFGAFHGSIWRFLPTALLGMVMAYLVLETDNMFYNGLFHCINNALPILLLYGMQPLYNSVGSTEEVAETAISGSAGILAVGAYMMIGSIAPFLIYLGNYLLHRGNDGYRKTLFPSGKPATIIFFILITIAMLVVGMTLIVSGVLNAPGAIDSI